MQPLWCVFLKWLSNWGTRKNNKILGKKNDKIKDLLYINLCQTVDLTFRTVVKSLRLSWLGRFLNRTNESWQAIPNDSFHRYGGLRFLLKCNYHSKLLDKQPTQSFVVKCWIISRNCVQVTLMSIEVNSFFGMTKKPRYRE